MDIKLITYKEGDERKWIYSEDLYWFNLPSLVYSSRVTLILILFWAKIFSYTLDESLPSPTKNHDSPSHFRRRTHSRKQKITTLFYVSQIILAKWNGCSLAWEMSLKNVSGILKGNDGNVTPLSEYDMQYISLISLVSLFQI